MEVLTAAPLPDWRILSRALMFRGRTKSSLDAPWRCEEEVAGWLSRSAWSLVRVAAWRLASNRSKTITMWFPEFFCNSTLLPLRAMGVKLVFYRVTPELQPDYVSCRELAESATPDLFVLVHYFGAPAKAAPAWELCKQHRAWLIEDAAHVLRRTADIGAYGDFVMYSPHKLLPIPDGAILVARANGPAAIGAEGLQGLGDPGGWTTGLTSLIGRDVSLQIYGSNRQALKWLAKRILQKIGARGRTVRSVFPEPDLGVPQKVFLPDAGMSKLSKRLTEALLPTLAEVGRWRHRHLLLWDELLARDEPNNGLGLGSTRRPEARQWSPYLASYAALDGSPEGAFETLKRWRIPVATWPDMPPESHPQGGEETQAWKARHGRLYLPVHQSMRVRDVLARMPRSKSSLTKGAPAIDLRWDGVTREEWRGWMRQGGRSNLLQSWAYGVAKAETEGWQVRRGTFSHAGAPVAFVQVLERRIAGAIRLSRVNRGPVLLRDAGGPLEEAVLRRLGEELSGISRGRILSLAPAIPLSGRAIVLLANLGYKQYSPNSWESAWVDLTQRPEDLRKRLNAKWRNTLVYAERQGLTLRVDDDEGALDWMLMQAADAAHHRGAGTPPAALYRTLRREAEVDAEPILIIRAIVGTDPVAGICIARHGRAATYMLGWNGEVGRKMKANQWLLWQAIAHLRACHCEHLDLGGIDEEGTPGVSAFKLGLNGERYTLVGEAVRW